MSNDTEKEEWYLISGDELRVLYASKTLANAKNALDNIYKPLEQLNVPKKNGVDEILTTISKRKVVGVPNNIVKKDSKNYNKGQYVGDYNGK
jgi:hypothetical protein